MLSLLLLEEWIIQAWKDIRAARLNAPNLVLSAWFDALITSIIASEESVESHEVM